MKKILALVLALMLLGSAAALADVKIGQVDYAAHGTKCFAVLTAVVDGDTIVAAHIDEFQPMAADSAVGVPNNDTVFPALVEAGQVLGSKRVNNGMYSTNMAGHAGSTQPLGVSYDAIEAFVTGKTIAEVEAAIAGKTAAEMVDAVSSCTLADTLGYVTGLVEAAKAASLTTGYYTIYNKTGETVSEITLVNNANGEVLGSAANVAADAICVITGSGVEGTEMTLSFKTESGYEGAFTTLHIETVPMTLLAADALTGATPLTFFAPAE